MLDNNSLTPSDNMVWLALTVLIPTQRNYPIKREDIALVAGVSKRTVSRSLTRLSGKGIISFRKRPSQPHIYDLHRDMSDDLLVQCAAIGNLS